MAEMTGGSQSAPNGTHAGNIVNIFGAVLSVGLVIGVGVWGYKLLMRDVTGVPVVRAMQGEMRVAPENPGGEIAAHTGLAVNAVPAEGGAAEPEDRLVLAPVSTQLQDEDLEVAPLAEANEVAPSDPAPEMAEVTPTVADASEAEATPRNTAEPLSAEDVLALADQIAAGAAPLTDLAEGEDVPVAVAVNGVDMADFVDPSVPGVSTSLRPQVRPARLVAAAAPAAQPAAAVAETPEPSAPTLTGALPAGTKLVQLGAFDSAEIAAREWTRLSGRFGDFMGDKSRVIQEAQSGGRTFYRLRAQGFADLSDARRFCAALVAEDAPCIPVVVR